MNNNETMSDYLDFEMPDNWKVLFIDGTYAEIQTQFGKKYEVHASGNGDAFNHKIEFVEIKKNNIAKSILTGFYAMFQFALTGSSEVLNMANNAPLINK